MDSTTAVSSSAPRRKSLGAHSRRGTFIKWLRKTHSWLGLWGAILGMMFGLSGFFQNHRAIMRIDTSAPVVTNINVKVPDSVPQTPEAVGVWLQQEWGLSKPLERSTRMPPQAVSWGGRNVQQTEHWQLMFRSPTDMIQVDYAPDTRQASARRSVPGWLGVLENLHKSVGVGAAWVLLMDTIAGCMIILSLTGLLLWTELERKKLTGAIVFVSSVVALLAATAVTF